MLQNYTTKKVHVFEPSSKLFGILKKTLSLNKSDRIVALNQALGSKKETLKLNLGGDGSSFVFDNKQGSESVSVIKLDDYVKKNKLQVGFIKMDVEGFEMELIKGALETIKTQKPAMLISLYHKPSDFFDIKPFLESLNLGYTFKIRKCTAFCVSMETVLYCEVV